MGQMGGLLSHNLFAYCENNPVNMSDPNGNIPVEDITYASNAGLAALGAALGALLSNPIGWGILAVAGITYIAVNNPDGNVSPEEGAENQTRRELAKASNTAAEQSTLTNGEGTVQATRASSVSASRPSISTRILKPDGKVDLSKFNRKGPSGPGGKPYWLGPAGWKIIEEVSNKPHGGSTWKLINRAWQRIGTLLSDGTIIRK